MSQRRLRVSRSAAIALIPIALAGCGSGAAALFSAADTGDDAPPQPFNVRFDASNPRMFAAETDSQITSSIDDATSDVATSTPVLQLEFTRLPDADSVQPSDFTVTRVDPNNTDLEPVPAMQVRVNTSGVEIVLEAALYLNGLYRVDVVGQVSDIIGLPLTGPRMAFFQVGPGALDPNEELVTFGETFAGGLRLGGANRTFASVEAQVGNTFFIATNSADSSGVYTAPSLLYQNSGQSFDQLNTSGIQLSGTTAVIRTQEGRLTQIHNGNPDQSVRVKAFPGRIESVGGEITWPNLVNANVDSDRYVIDRGPDFEAGGPTNNKHIAWRPRLHPLTVQQSQNALGKNVVTWWAWRDESASGDSFETYGVYGNFLDQDLGFVGEWSEPVLLSSPADDSVGWPISTSFPDGSVVALWHDAPTQEELYEADISRYQGARFSSLTNTWGPSSTYNLGTDLGRIGSVNSVGADEILVFARLDQDGNSTVGQPERASVTVRRLGFDSAGNLTAAGGSSTAIVAPPSPDADGFYSLALGYESALPSGSGLPQPDQYVQVRDGISRQTPRVASIDGVNYLVSWNDTSPSGTPRLWISVFDSANMVWRNGEAIDVIEQLGLTSLGGEFAVIGVAVDRLGFATVAWREGPSSRSLAARMVRTSGSILGGGSTNLSDVFPTDPSEALTIVKFVSNDPNDPDNLAAGGSYPSFVGLSNVDGSGHIAYFWAREYVENASAPGIVIGTNARRFR